MFHKAGSYFQFKALGILTLVFLVCHLSSSAQDSVTLVKYKPKTQLIDSIKRFITTDLKMNVQSNFYTHWKEPSSDSMFIYFYISRPDRVEYDTTNKISWTFESDSLALATAREMTEKGFHTLVYRTAGMSNTLLTPKLLSYADEAIAFICFHEVVHQNLQKMGGTVHYNYEEALCDVIANVACVRFAETTHMIDIHAAEKQRDIFERLYAFMNKERSILDTMQQQNKPALYQLCTNTISMLTTDANQFVKDRMNYEVNNAYFLRISSYALSYFKMKELFDISNSFADVVNRIEDLQNKRLSLKGSFFSLPSK